MTGPEADVLEARVGRGRATGIASAEIAKETGRGFGAINVQLYIDGTRITSVHELRLSESTNGGFIIRVVLSPKLKRESTLDAILDAATDDSTWHVEVTVQDPQTGAVVRTWSRPACRLQHPPRVGRPIVFVG